MYRESKREQTSRRKAQSAASPHSNTSKMSDHEMQVDDQDDSRKGE